MSDLSKNLLFTSLQIQQAVQGMARQIARWRKNQPQQALNLISILQGARPFARDLVGALRGHLPEVKILLHEIRIQGTDGIHLLKERRWLEGQLDPRSLQNHGTLLVDDLMDSGLTLQTLKTKFLELGAQEIKTAVLIRKYSDTGGPVDFCGFDLNLKKDELLQRGIQDYWLLGYGMDWNGLYRELEHIEYKVIR